MDWKIFTGIKGEMKPVIQMNKRKSIESLNKNIWELSWMIISIYFTEKQY